MNLSKLIDNKFRHLNYLRISITDRCNLRCAYCTPIKRNYKLKHSDILSYEEILRIVKIGISLGIKKIRVTGGEPLLRKGFFDFINTLSSLPGICDLSLTTNGILLSRKADQIIKSGIKRINVSLDSLISNKYRSITGSNEFNKVWNGIILAHNIGFYPIKINVVAMKGFNDDEFLNFAALTFDYPFHIRFIEHMPIGITRVKTKSQILNPDIRKKISKLGILIPIKNKGNDGPARRFKFEGAIGEIGFISALSRHFCYDCNRLRLTADGLLRPCLLSDYSVSLKNKIRQGCNDNELVKLFFIAAQYKERKHSLIPNKDVFVKGRMYAIGG